MPDAMHVHADEPPHPHGPEHSAVRYERRDARLKLVVVFVVILVGGAILGHVALYALTAGLESGQRRRELRDGPPLPAVVRESRPHFPAQLEVIQDKYHSPPLQVSDRSDMDALRARDQALLDSSKDGRLPIEQALQMIANPKIAQSRGIIARAPKETP